MTADLHIHSTASDGKCTSTEIVLYAKKEKLSTISITDHDTVDGIDEALEAGQKNQLEVIPGIELSTLIDETEVHLLGYFINYQSPLLKEYLNIFQEDRIARAHKVIYKLNKIGIDINFNDVEKIANGAVISRVHIALALQNKLIVYSIDEAFQKYLNYGAIAYVPRKKLGIAEAIILVKTLDGIPILAHPGFLDRNTFNKALGEDIAGIEVFYPQHNSKQVKYFLEICEEKNLLITGGSDFHGISTKPKNYLGSIRLQDIYLKQLKAYKQSS